MKVNKGDILYLRNEFKQKINIQSQTAEVLSYDGLTIELYTNGGKWWCGWMNSEMLEECFYLNSNLNNELLDLMMYSKIQFKSINAVTVDGKVINMELGN